MLKPDLVRSAQAAQEMGIGRSSFWLYAKTKPGFPKGFRLSPRCTLWSRRELATWLEAQRTGDTSTTTAASTTSEVAAA
jgi:predicted DNA-binding transcriptional regulator AlpA